MTDKASVERMVIGFCHLLRDHGLSVAQSESADALRGLASLDVGDRADVYFGLRGLLTSAPDDLAIYDALFRQYWSGTTAAGTIPKPGAPARKTKRNARAPSFSLESWVKAPREELESVSMKAPSATEQIGGRMTAGMSAHEIETIRRLARQVARRLANRPGRRWRAARRGTQIDMRKSFSRSVITGGTVAQLARRQRRARKTRIVALCDVSGSMELFSRFFLEFLVALQRGVRRTETFVFATKLTRISDDLRPGRLQDVLDRLADHVPDWAGGTRIGDAIAEFNTRWSRLVDRHTIVIVLSDGWETGDPAVLGAELARLAARSRRVIWLSPLLGGSGDRRLTEGLAAAAPYVDVLAPLTDLGSLRSLARHLTR